MLISKWKPAVASCQFRAVGMHFCCCQTNMKRRLLLNVSPTPGSVVQSLSSMAFSFLLPPSSIFSPSSAQCMTCSKNRWWKGVWGEISYKDVVCEFQSWEKKNEREKKKKSAGGGGLTSLEMRKEKRKGGGGGGLRMLPWCTTSVNSESFECCLSGAFLNRNNVSPFLFFLISAVQYDTSFFFFLFTSVLTTR